MVIVDTSVAIKWFFEESGSSEARSLLREAPLGAPDLLHYEFCNFLACKDFITEQEASRFLTQLYHLPLQIFLLPEKGFKEALWLSKKYRLSFYDASFIALADSLGADLVTADRKLFLKVKPLSFVRLIQ